MRHECWKGKRVFLTGHTGFKGSWMALWLQSLGADVTGYSLEPPTDPSLFRIARVGAEMRSIIADIRDGDRIKQEMKAARPEIVIHMAAQSLVRHSYLSPVETYSTNVMGTVHVLEAVRSTPSVRAVVNITTDKCYENREWFWGYRESDALGGFDPYSSSKGCAELVASGYRASFFNAKDYAQHGVGIASVRAGNVIGGGDWAKDRLIPDILRAIENGTPVLIRNPRSIRPWQHVLEPLGGYLRLAEALISDEGCRFADAWNFGPDDADARPVQWIVERMVQQWGPEARWTLDGSPQPHEATYLKLDCSKARTLLGWQPKWSLTETITGIVEWHKAFLAGDEMSEVTLRQIAKYQKTQTT